VQQPVTTNDLVTLWEQLWEQSQREEQQNQLDEALATYMKLLALLRQENERKAEGVILYRVGIVYYSLGKPDAALKAFQEALLILREVKYRRGEGTTLNNIAAVYSDLGKPDAALKAFQEALLILREVKDRSGEGTTLNNIAAVYSDLGKPEEALKTYQQALLIRREVKDRSGEGTTLYNIAAVYSDLGKPEEALKTLQQVLLIHREVKHRSGKGATLNNIGKVYSDLGKPEEALKAYQQALLILREVKHRSGEGATLNNIGKAYSDLGKPEEALKAYQQALLINRETGNLFSESTTLANLGFLQRDQKQYAPAIENLEKALSIQLNVRSGLQRKDRQTFLSKSQAAANELVGLLIEQQRPADAFRWVNLFGSADLADYSRLIDAQLSDPQAQAALTQWRQGQQALAALRQQLQEKADSRNLQQLVEQEAEQQRQAETLISRYPQIAELLETRPADLQRLQAVIPAGTVVLQPALLTGVPKRPDTAALFVLTPTALQVVSVPLPAGFNQQIEAYRQKLEDATSYLQQSQDLYDLLIRPVEEKGLLPAGSRLALITTGKLREIPLETLYDRRSEQYLIEKYPIHYLTRLSRTAAPAAGRSGPGGRRALVLANPTPSQRPLPGTEAEAAFLVGAYPGSRELSGGQATLAQFQQQASRYPILHLGTHGCFIAGGCPELGMQANTLLFANGVHYPIAEAARLGLTNTELLVLAACQTARITDDSDVGLSGLAYVWERAGARAVVASLWSAPDTESSLINKAFYANLKTGMDKAEAMRQAKISLLRSTADGRVPVRGVKTEARWP
jgi:CHAT domain-containing protein/predicted negative regulator of RcsB-dependent stress response